MKLRIVAALLAIATTNPVQIKFTANGPGSAPRPLASKLGDVVSVKDFGCVGDGVATEDTCLANARAAMAASPGTLVFPQGTYKYTTSPNWAIAGVRLLGLGVVTLQFNGTGNAVVFDTGPTINTFTYDVRMENFTISGTGAATNGLYLRSIHHSHFKNIRVTAVSAACLLTNYVVVDVFDSFRCSGNEAPFGTVPVNGMYLDRRNAGENTNANTFINTIIESVSGSGIKLVYGLNNTFLGGTSEQNLNGFEIQVNSARNSIYDTDCEQNTGEDYIVQGPYNNLNGVLAGSLGNAGAIHFSTTSALQNVVMSGEVNWIKIDAGANSNRIDNVVYNVQGTGGFTDNGTATSKITTTNVVNVLPDATVIPGGLQVPGGIDMPSLTSLVIGGVNASTVQIGRTGWATQINSNLTLAKRQAVADAPYTAISADYTIAYTTLTAARVVTLPTAVGNTGLILVIKDEAGTATGVITIGALAIAGQSIDGTANPTVKVLVNSAFGAARLYSNGANWFTF